MRRRDWITALLWAAGAACVAYLLILAVRLDTQAQPPVPAPPSVPTPAWLNVKDFGAVGDAAHDDAPALQAAIDAASVLNGTLNEARRGGTVCLPSGVYLCQSTIVLKPRVRLVGTGRDTSILRAKLGTLDCLRAHGVGWGLENLGLFGGRYNLHMGVDGAGTVKGSNSNSVQGCQLMEATASGIRNGGGNIWLSVRDSQIGCTGSGAGLDLEAGKQFTNTTFDNVKFWGSGTVGTGRAILDNGGAVGRLSFNNVTLQGPFSLTMPTVTMGSWDYCVFSNWHVSDNAGNMTAPVFLLPSGCTSQWVTWTGFAKNSGRVTTFRLDGTARDWTYTGSALGGSQPNPTQGWPGVNAFTFGPAGRMDGAMIRARPAYQSDLADPAGPFAGVKKM